MADLSKWTLNTIRDDYECIQWMEERRFEWTPLTQKAINNIISGMSCIVLSDSKHQWVASYLMGILNNCDSSRPLLPFINGNTSYHEIISNIQNSQEIELFEDMLSLSFPNGYFFLYIGKDLNVKARVSKRNTNSFLWIFDEDVQNSFTLEGDDDLIDIKLVQLCALFNKSINHILFEE